MQPQDLPALYRSADQLSLDSQKYFFRALFWHLLMLLSAAVLSVINSSQWWAAGLQAFTLLIALSCSIYLATKRPDKVWYSARALAESVKTMSWRYVSCAEPFEGTASAARAEFRRKLIGAFEQNKEVVKALTAHLEEAQIPERLDTLRAKPLQERMSMYREQRVNNQLTWYARKAKFNRNASRWAFGFLILANAIALGFAIAKIRYTEIPYWPTDAFVTLAACALTWMQAKRFSELSSSYALAAHEISLIRESMVSINAEAAFSAFVGDAENAFSREHTQWIARQDV